MNKNQLLIELEKRGIKLWLENDLLNIEAPKGTLTPELRDSLKEHKPEIIKLLNLSNIKTTSLPIIKPNLQQRHQPFTLTDIQQAHWLGRNQVFELSHVSNHVYIEFETNKLEISRLAAAWQKLIQRHDMLRAIVLPTGEQQILDQVPDYQITILDLRESETSKIETELIAIREKLSQQNLPSHQWPWFDIRASYLNQQRIRLHLSMDLLLIDAASLRILFHEWNQLYQNIELSLPPLELSFRDYVIAKHSLQDSELVKRSQTYWFNRLDTLPPAPELPLALFPSELKEYTFKRYAGKLEPHIWQKLKQRGQKAGLTPSIILLTAFAEVLTLWSKNPHFTLNLTVLERLPLHPQINQIIGDFTNTNLLAIDNSSPNTFTNLALKIQQQLLQDLDHIYISGVEVLRKLLNQKQTELTAAMPIVFSSVLGLGTFAQGDLEYNFLGEVVYGISQTPQVSLEHQVAEHNGSLIFNWDAVEALFPMGMLDEMFTVYCNLLERLAQENELWTEPIELLPPAQIYHPHTPIPQTALLHTLFFKQVSQRPQQQAVISSNRILTYQELNDRVTELARQLGDHSQVAIAIIMEKGWKQVVAALAILAAGGIYVPIDPGLPKERIWYCLQQARVKLVLTETCLVHSLEYPENIPILCIDSLQTSPSHQPFQQIPKPTDLAYIIYTSGSTGTPKGVMITHESAVNTILDINERFRINSSDRILAISALSFDLSVYDIFGILAAGGTIVIPDAANSKDPSHWSELITKHQITIWNSVPAFMQMLIEYNLNHPQVIFNTLRLVLLSGDWIPLNLPTQIQTLSPQAEIISLGGATEASIWSIYYPITQVDPNWKSIPYGKPLKNQYIYVLNTSLKKCPVWVTGELYIGGISLAKGYWQDEEKTNASFITDPVTKEKLYKTGDLGRYLPDGNIEFLGREDFQVKINGYRIELGEIEATLKQHPTVKEVVVTTVPKTQQLIAYIVPQPESNITTQETRSFLQTKLPAYMIPSTFVLLASFPLTANGKVDRQALPILEGTQPELTQTFTPPRNQVEELLITTWTELFKLQQISIYDNFFALGGHSFLALQLISKINHKFQTNIPLSTLFHYPTVAELGNFLIQNYHASSTPISLVPIQPQGTQPPLFCIHPTGGQVMVYQHLATCLGTDRPVYALQSRALNNSLDEHNSIENMAGEYVKIIRQHQPHGSYHLMGWSMGGVIAVSVTKELEQQGCKVDFLGLVDAFLFPDSTPTFTPDPLYELALVFGGTFVDALMTLDTVQQQQLREQLISLTCVERLQLMMNWGQSQNLLSKELSEVSIEILQKQLELTEIHQKLLKNHQPPQIQAQIFIWWAAQQLTPKLPRTNWSQYTINTTHTKILDGNHFTIMLPPCNTTLAQQLQEYI
ncbi:amino acid adenylation domain-containing protein [Komarekiella sp. 'clone 1']|uniref:Amino acid adenylation domain-containing protein n=1 Tax=Komarekiella delphini-convector SJRDD-AB1 TaxID=2593771 RepID=A0AA40T2T2_9NOST|nr:non-ribosomal peptide synthetase [Komarekiella delphini-convector]MBD6619878.1 amino acid adenylation domain-containing protein [Komarekiella delphini-convector SJRDD-AB1]